MQRDPDIAIDERYAADARAEDPDRVRPLDVVGVKHDGHAGEGFVVGKQRQVREIARETTPATSS